MGGLIQPSVLEKAADKVLDKKLEAAWRNKLKRRRKWAKLSRTRANETGM